MVITHQESRRKMVDTRWLYYPINRRKYNRGKKVNVTHKAGVARVEIHQLLSTGLSRCQGYQLLS